MRAYISMYEGTLDLYYLRELVDHADTVLLNRGSGDFSDCWPVDFQGDEVFDYCHLVHTGILTYPMARFAAIVEANPSLASVSTWDGSTFGQKASEYVTEVKAAVAYHTDTGPNDPDQWVDGPGADEGYFRYPEFLPPGHPNRNELEGINLPWNMDHAMGRTLLSLAAADPGGGASYLDMADRMAELFTRPNAFLCTDNEGDENKPYVWNYSNYGHCNTICEDECTSGCPIGSNHTRDIAHASANVDFATVAESYGIVFNDNDGHKLRKFVATYVKNIVKNDPLWYQVWDTVDGCFLPANHSPQVGRWMNLSPWDDNGGIYLSVQAIYGDAFTDSTVQIGPRLLAVANLARWEGAFKMYGVRTGPGSGSNWADVTGADLNNDGTDWILGIRNFDDKLLVYDYDPAPGLASTDRIGIVLSYEPPNAFNLAAVTSGDFENNGIEKVAVLAQNSIQSNNAWIYFLEYDEMTGVLDPVGDTSMGGSNSGFVGMGAGEFEAQAGTWAAVVRNNDDRFSLFKCTFGPGGVTATLQGSHFFFPQTVYQWADLAVGDFDGDGLAEIAAIGNDPNENVNAILVVLEWNPLRQELQEVTRKDTFGSKSDLAAVTAADLDGDGVDEILMARNVDGSVRRYDLVLDQGQYTITQLDKAVPYGASKSYGGLAGGRFSTSSNDEFLVSMSNQTGDIHLYGIPGAGDCPWDLDCDGTVGGSDLLIFLAAVGPCPVKGPCQMPIPCVPDPLGPCAADFDGDGTVGAADQLALLANWGACP